MKRGRDEGLLKVCNSKQTTVRIDSGAKHALILIKISSTLLSANNIALIVSPFNKC